MATLVALTPTQEKIEGFQVATAIDMIDALDWISQFPSGHYSGMVQVQVAGGVRTWTLLINNTATNSSAFANTMDIVIIENDTVVSVCKQADFDSRYTIISE